MEGSLIDRSLIDLAFVYNFKRVLGPRDQRIQRLFQKFYSKDESLEDIEINLLLQALVEQNKHQNFKEMS